MPISLSIEFMSSIWSDEISSDGRTAFNSSCVTQPRFLAILSIRLTAASLRSSRGLSGVSTTADSPSPFASSFFAIAASPSSRGQRRRVSSIVLRPTRKDERSHKDCSGQSLRPSFREAPNRTPLSPSLARAVAHLSWGLSGQIADEAAPGLIAKTVDRCFGIHKVGQIRFDIKQSGKIKLVGLRRERPLGELQVPM